MRVLKEIGIEDTLKEQEERSKVNYNLITWAKAFKEFDTFEELAYYKGFQDYIDFENVGTDKELRAFYYNQECYTRKEVERAILESCEIRELKNGKYLLIELFN